MRWRQITVYGMTRHVNANFAISPCTSKHKFRILFFILTRKIVPYILYDRRGKRHKYAGELKTAKQFAEEILQKYEIEDLRIFHYLK